MATSTSPSKPLDRSIVEGPTPRAVWMLAWPTMLQNLIGGLQGIVDHALVGHLVGFAGNAAIGVALQIFMVGQASIQTARGIGPSTMERSSGLEGDVDVAMAIRRRSPR